MKRMNQTNTKKDKDLRYVAESIHRCLTSQIKATSESIGRDFIYIFCQCILYRTPDMSLAQYPEIDDNF